MAEGTAGGKGEEASNSSNCCPFIDLGQLAE
jgi:hypothetical protein